MDSTLRVPDKDSRLGSKRMCVDFIARDLNYKDSTARDLNKYSSKILKYMLGYCCKIT